MPDNKEENIRPASGQGQSTSKEGTVMEDVHGHKFMLRPGWVVPRDDVPPPTYWPVVMAFGITLIAFGVVTTVIITVIGFILFAVSLAGWIGDIRNEQREHAKKHRH